MTCDKMMKKQANFLLRFVGLTIAFVKEMTILIPRSGETSGRNKNRPRSGATAHTRKEDILMDYVMYFTVSFAAALAIPSMVMETAISVGKSAFNRLSGKTVRQ